MKALEEEILTAEDVAGILAVKVSTVGDYARRGVLPSFKVGKHRRFKRSQIEAWLANQSKPNPYR